MNMSFWLIILLTTSKTPGPLRHVLIGMACILGILIPLFLFADPPKSGRLIAVLDTLGWTLLFGVVMFYGPRVRCNLGLWYPKQMKRYERVETWGLWAILIWQGVRLVLT